MKKKKLLMLIGSVCLSLVLAALLLPACAPAVPEAEEVAELEAELAAEKAKTAEEKAKVSDLEKEIAALKKPAEVKPIVWRLNGHYEESGTYADMYRWLAKSIEERSGGRMEVEVYYSGALGYRCQESFSVCSQGLVDINEVVSSAGMGECVLTAIPNMPFNWEKTSDGIFWSHEVFLPVFNEVLEKDWNSRVISEIENHFEVPALLFSKEPLSKPEDFVGKKVRSFGGTVDFALTSIGMTPFVITTAEIYSALQSGMIDTVLTGWGSATECKFWEVLKYIDRVPISTHQINWMIGNLDSFNALPEDLQEVVITAGQDATNFTTRNDFFWGPKLEQMLIDNGMVVVEPEPGTLQKFMELTRPEYKKWTEKQNDPIVTELMRSAGLID